ncbi:NAD-dependent epimerase/dehydratase family protein [Saccharospirillum impatiens]|uniref:NAD-dependent epimerase/dehydratase family protein n=1 Tax=Saccharospirillum impatiens TaxID=169438 RepID=UPI0003FD73C9|nr:NAD-dependent epimerase/dehydratase family protein [Saccharospirillum impatiens]
MKDTNAPQHASTALVVGGTGLIGSSLQKRLKPDHFDPVWLLTRRPQPKSQSHLHWVNTDFTTWPDASAMDLQGGTLFCTLGTTLKKAGSREAFVALDRDLVVNTAHWARDLGVRTCLFVSSLGADPQSRQLYLRTKGEAEQELIALGFDRLVVMRPSLLLGHRNEFRLGERLGAAFGAMLRPALSGPLLKYRPVQADQVAAAMVAAASKPGPAIDIWESGRISQFRSE